MGLVDESYVGWAAVHFDCLGRVGTIDDVSFRISGRNWVCPMFRIEFTPEAFEDLQLLRKFDQQQIIAAIEVQLPHQATQETRNRKRLRPNQLAEWELRVDQFRVFYDVDARTNAVKIEAVGSKQGSRLFLHGQEYQL
jgi:mRNA-degrading endonuclease RelE of RelBE toxin-antitoxin system